MTTQGDLAPLRNVAALLETVDQLQHRSITLPGIGVFYGAHGAGKSTATTFAANHYNAVVVEAKSYWTRQHMVDTLLDELQIKGVRGTLPRKVEAVCAALAISGRTLIFDDAQYMMKLGMLDLARDIFQGCFSPMVFVGEPDFEANLTRWPNIYDRVLVSTETISCNADDAGHLASIYCAGIEVVPQTIRTLVRLTGGSARKLSMDFERIREAARRFNVRRVADLPEALHATVFDMYVNAGNNAVKLLQELLTQMGERCSIDGAIGPQTIAAARNAWTKAPNHLVDAYGIARRNYYFHLADRRPASRKYARTKAGGKGGWIKRAEEFISPRYHMTDEQFRARVAAWG